MTWSKFAAAVCAASLLLLGSVVESRAGEADARVKAAFILNIMRFVDFGSYNRADTLVLCAQSNAPSASRLPGLSGEQVGTRRIAFRDYKASGNPGCDVIYLSSASASSIDEARKPGVLLIGDGADFIGAGGMIGLLSSGDQVRFEVNTQSARSGGIRFSSKLLRLATRVR